MKARNCLLAGCGLVALTVAVSAEARVLPMLAVSEQSAVLSAGPSQPNPQANATSTADDSQVDENAPRDGKARVEERDIIVTGARFQKLLDLPQSKSIITAEDRNLAGVGNTRQLLDVQPGFNFTEQFGINVRGVGRQTPQTLLGQENAVIQYVDGFINLVPSNIAESTLFGGNVQFLRGPGGTTYGRNSIAGAINLLSRAPTPDYTAQVQAGFGRAGSYNVGANISGPITSNLGFRVGIQEFVNPTIQKNMGSAKGAGFATNNRYIEFQLEWRVGGFHIRNRATTFTYDNQPNYPTIAAYNVGAPFRPAAGGAPAVAATGVFGGLSPNPQFQYSVPAPTGAYQINVDYTGYDRLRDNFQDIVNADLDIGFANLVYVGGYQKYLATGSADRDLTSRSSYDPFALGTNGAPIAPVFARGTIIPTDYRASYDNKNYFWSQEARLESKSGSALSWVAGFYYFKQHFNEHYYESIANAGDVLTTGGGGGTLRSPNPLKAEFEQRNILDIKSTAVFGNITYDILPTLRFDGGLRHTWDEKSASTDFRYIFYYPPFFAGDVSPAIHSANPFKRDKGLSGRASLAWRPSPGDQLYVSYQRGYQSSAFTLGQGLPPNNIAKSEHLDVYEIGGNLTTGRLRFDGSVFYQNFSDMQIPIATRNTGVVNGETVPVGPVFSNFTNAALARIYGAEAQVTWRPNVQSNIVASYTYLHPTFRNFCPVLTPSVCGAIDITEPATIGGVANPLRNKPQDLSGNQVPRTPHHKASLYGYYGFDLGTAGHLYPGGSIAYQTSFYTSAFNAPRFKVDGRTIVGLTLTYRTPDDRLDVTGTVSNLFRKIYSDNGSVSSFGATATNATTYGQDQYWTVTARYRF